jgi:hypothetical protein
MIPSPRIIKPITMDPLLKTISSLSLFLAIFFQSTWLLADDRPPVTTLLEPTKQIVSTPFNEATLVVRKGKINDWQASIGEWQVKDGVLYGSELAEDNHASSCTYRIEADNLIITAKFKLGKAEHVAFGCRDSIEPFHHLGRTFISRDEIWIQKMSGIAKTTKATKLKELKTPINPDAWYDLTIEICGDHYRATVGEHVIEGHDDRFKDSKGLVALIVKGQGAQFKNVTLWNAKPRSTR